MITEGTKLRALKQSVREMRDLHRQNGKDIPITINKDIFDQLDRANKLHNTADGYFWDGVRVQRG